jgi:hypothetical protein
MPSEGDFSKNYCIHLAESQNWNKYLKDLTPEVIKTTNNNFAKLFKGYIGG